MGRVSELRQIALERQLDALPWKCELGYRNRQLLGTVLATGARALAPRRVNKCSVSLLLDLARLLLRDPSKLYTGHWTSVQYFWWSGITV
jgi:hypothetical protein